MVMPYIWYLIMKLLYTMPIFERPSIAPGILMFHTEKLASTLAPPQARLECRHLPHHL